MEHYIEYPTMQEVWNQTNHIIKSLGLPGKWEYVEGDDCGGGTCFNYRCGMYTMKLNNEGIYIYCNRGYRGYDKKYCLIKLDEFDITTVNDIVTKTLPDFDWPKE